MTTASPLSQPIQRVIGLTGGIAMGKTTISDYLATAHHLPVLDADVYAREAVEPGRPELAEIVERYGSGVLLPDGRLNRSQLGMIIFSSAAERLWVEQCIHPYVRDRLVTVHHTLPLNNPQQHPILIMVIPLLFEARMTDLVTETWVVTCSETEQIQRLMQRNHLTQDQARARIKSQMDIQQKIARADVVLQNTSTLTALQQQVDQQLANQPADLATPCS